MVIVGGISNMLMLENLKKRIKLIPSLENALNYNKYLCIILEDNSCAHSVLEKSEINRCFSIFNKSDISFAGASHGIVMSPLFALTISENKHTAVLDQYLTIFDDNSNVFKEAIIKREIDMLTVAVSFFYPQITEIKIPLIMDISGNNDWDAKVLSDGCLLSIKGHK